MAIFKEIADYLAILLSWPVITVLIVLIIKNQVFKFLDKFNAIRYKDLELSVQKEVDKNINNARKDEALYPDNMSYEILASLVSNISKRDT